MTVALRCIEIELALNRSAHRLDQVSRLLGPRRWGGSVVELVEQVLDLGTGVERFVAVVFLVPVANYPGPHRAGSGVARRANGHGLLLPLRGR